MARLFGRTWRVRIDTIQFTELDCSFTVEKSTKREPNKCSLRVWNLTAENRAQLEALSVTRQRGAGRIRVEIEAGYGDRTSLLFRGDLRHATTSREGPDLVTELEGEDGGRAVLWGRVNRSFPPGTRVDQVVRACAEAMGVGAGNTDELLRGARFEGTGTTFPEGTVLRGQAATELERLLRGMGLRYSIQNGVLQILQRGRALQETAVLLSPDTGLVDRPEVNVDGTVGATCLLLPDLYPGRQVQFDGVNVAGTWRVEKVKYQGDTFGAEWYAHLECKALVRRT